jgi:hypothetical protein
VTWNKCVTVGNIELGVCYDDIFLRKSIDKLVPKSIYRALTDRIIEARPAGHHFDGAFRVATIDSFVVAMELSECLFKEYWPETLVVRWLGQCSIAPAVEGDVVIDHNRGRKTQVIEIDTIDSRVVQFLGKEQVFDQVWIGHTEGADA